MVLQYSRPTRKEWLLGLLFFSVFFLLLYLLKPSPTPPRTKGSPDANEVPSVEHVSMDIDPRVPKLKVAFDYAKATSVLVVGCQTHERYPATDRKGRLLSDHGRIDFEHCRLKRDYFPIVLMARGMPPDYPLVRKSYIVALEKPNLELLAGPENNQRGIRVSPQVSRRYQIIEVETGAILAAGTTPWVKSLQIQTAGIGGKWDPLRERRNVYELADVTQAFWIETASPHWRLKVRDFGNRSYFSDDSQGP